MLHSLYRSQFLDKRFQTSGVAHHDGQCTGEQAVVRIYAYAPQRNSGFFGDDGSDVRYDTDVVVPHYTQCDGVLGPLGFTRPACLYDTVSETLAQVARVRAIAAVYFDTSAYGDKAEYLVAVDWIAATCQFCLLYTSPSPRD